MMSMPGLASRIAGLPWPRPAAAPDSTRLLAWCEELAACAPAFAPPLAEKVLTAYEEAGEEGRRALLAGLAARFAPDAERLGKAVADFQTRGDPASLTELHAASEPRSQQLIRNLNLAGDGTFRLIRMRSDLIAWRRDIPGATALDADFAHLLTSWFNTGFLRLEPITWSSPASLLRKIITYEAVHEIGDWEELRRRLEPEDRRCYAFFHSRMPGEPLIFVEVALTAKVPGSIAALLSPERPAVAPKDARTAVFYSISNCQEGLRGVPFGSALIKQVVASLQAELPTLRTFVTLSPLPGLRAWAEKQIGLAGEDLSPEEVRGLAALYLLTARTPSGEPLDPVARFHLGNGASVLELHPSGDPSAKGRRQSLGAMVNYLYDLGALERNRAALTAGEVRAARRIRGYLRQAASRLVAV
jgi:malonyl-CoA decarboxylase